MKTYRTIDAARGEARTRSDVIEIAEIDHRTDGRCYILSRVPVAHLRTRLATLPEVARIGAAHSVATAAEIAAARESDLRDNCRCDRCGARIDGRTAYAQREHGLTVHYCSACAGLLASIGTAEHDGLAERAAERAPREPREKSDE